MGKRKPLAPRRRMGAHFVDLTIQRSVVVGARGANDIEHSEAPTPSVPWLLSEPASTATLSAAGASPPLPSPTTTIAASMPHSANMHTQQGSVPAAAAPHLHHVYKSTPVTVPPPPPSPSSVGDDSGARPRAPQAMPASEETVTITLAQLEAWKQRTILQIEDHFTNEQLKRIAEFGRVHANLVKEAKEYVAGIEAQLKEQFERERESLKQQAEAYVSQFQHENEQLRQRVEELEAGLGQIEEDRESEDEVLDDASGSESVGADITATIDFSADVPSTVAAGVTCSEGGDDTATLSSPSKVRESYLSGENASRVDAVAEAMSRAMGIRTPRVTFTKTNGSPREVLHLGLAPSPTTTNESSPADTSDGAVPGAAPDFHVREAQGTQMLTAEEDYL